MPGAPGAVRPSAEQAGFCPISSHEDLSVSFFPGLRRGALVRLRRRPPRPAAPAKTNEPPAVSTNAAAAQPAEEEGGAG